MQTFNGDSVLCHTQNLQNQVIGTVGEHNDLFMEVERIKSINQAHEKRVRVNDMPLVLE